MRVCENANVRCSGHTLFFSRQHHVKLPENEWACVGIQQENVQKIHWCPLRTQKWNNTNISGGKKKEPKHIHIRKMQLCKIGKQLLTTHQDHHYTGTHRNYQYATSCIDFSKKRKTLGKPRVGSTWLVYACTASRQHYSLTQNFQT